MRSLYFMSQLHLKSARTWSLLQQSCICSYTVQDDCHHLDLSQCKLFILFHTTHLIATISPLHCLHCLESNSVCYPFKYFIFSSENKMASESHIFIFIFILIKLWTAFLHLIWYLQFTTLFSLTSLEINYMQVLSPIYKKRNKWPRMFFILLAIELVIYGTKSRRTELLGLS